jgi:hypothetical protein
MQLCLLLRGPRASRVDEVADFRAAGTAVRARLQLLANRCNRRTATVDGGSYLIGSDTEAETNGRAAIRRAFAGTTGNDGKAGADRRMCRSKLLDRPIARNGDGLRSKKQGAGKAVACETRKPLTAGFAVVKCDCLLR